ncbi:MAG: hypothetical protein ACRDYA_16420 [Egibacteraceae bacterium]
MSVEAIGLTGGLLFLLIAVVGGGFTVRELIIPVVPKWARLSAALVGLLFSLPFLVSVMDAAPRPNADNSRSLDVSGAAPSAPAQEGRAQEGRAQEVRTPEVRTQGQIVFPEFGATVTEDSIDAAGTVSNLPDGHQLWTVVDRGLYYPNGGLFGVLPDGKWSGTIYFTDPGRFTVHLVEAGPKGTEQFTEYFEVGEATGNYHGIATEQLEPDVTILDSVVVMRE